MNCQLFETVIGDLARAAVMDAQSRDDAMAHSEACERCALRLRDEQMLTAGLRRVAASAEMKEAPARIETALHAAFREQRSHRPAPAINRPHTQPHTRSLKGWAVAAAVILILLVLAALRLDHASSRPVESARDVKPEQAAPKQTAPKEAAPKQTAPAVAPLVAGFSANTPSNIREQQAAGVIRKRPSQAPHRYTPNSKDGSGSNPQVSGPEATEIATEFIPIVHGDNLDSMESAQIVRVELPRSALISFGLPMNMERADERIKADVVLGNDGLARAIRFVR